MPLVKITRNGQLTLPAPMRRALKVGEGDYLEAELIGEVVQFRAVKIAPSDQADKSDEANRQLDAILSRIGTKDSKTKPSEDELMAEAAEEIRADRHAKSGS